MLDVENKILIIIMISVTIKVLQSLKHWAFDGTIHGVQGLIVHGQFEVKNKYELKK